MWAENQLKDGGAGVSQDKTLKYFTENTVGGLVWVQEHILPNQVVRFFLSRGKIHHIFGFREEVSHDQLDLKIISKQN